jgi:MauM/NapG family ferredoxin protein
VDLGRRRLVRAGFAGIVGAGIVGMNLIDREEASRAIRPPGALPEDDFSDRCIRCYACVRACSTSGGCLQPSLTEAGIESMLTPVAFMREGYCEFNCTLCGQVCPTGAIHELPLEEKKTRKMGLALINQSRCIPWESGEDCIVCEEHCPVPDKAILFDSREVQVAGKGLKTVKLPYVLRDRCIGCGICETKCPVTGEAAIVVSREMEERWLGV